MLLFYIQLKNGHFQVGLCLERCRVRSFGNEPSISPDRTNMQQVKLLILANSLKNLSSIKKSAKLKITTNSCLAHLTS